MWCPFSFHSKFIPSLLVFQSTCIIVKSWNRKIVKWGRPVRGISYINEVRVFPKCFKWQLWYLHKSLLNSIFILCYGKIRKSLYELLSFVQCEPSIFWNLDFGKSSSSSCNHITYFSHGGHYWYDTIHRIFHNTYIVFGFFVKIIWKCVPEIPFFNVLVLWLQL